MRHENVQCAEEAIEIAQNSLFCVAEKAACSLVFGPKTRKGARLMAVNWNSDQARKVKRALRDHPKHSGRCANAARSIVPVAQETDSQARGLVLRPKAGVGFCLVPKDPPPGPPFRHHVVTQTQHHAVDAY